MVPAVLLAAARTGSVLGYTGWLFLLQGAALPILAYARRGRGLARQARPYLLAGLAGGVLSLRVRAGAVGAAGGASWPRWW